MHLLHVGYTILYAHEPYIQTNTYIHTFFFYSVLLDLFNFAP